MPLDTPSYSTLIERLAQEAHQGCGLSYALYSQRFQSSIDALLERLPSDEKNNVIALAQKHGYEHEPQNSPHTSALSNTDDTQYCPHGIDIDCCPAGCGG
ncbi:hypothetical protein AB4391_01340 [Vibrio lentus]|uniref:Uncharacterized protein n=1 Tax=Vibrio lentus TaxID=136468 RepID=A0A2N7KP49_9VIBR|nr:hypothetical protein [Vibrio lentus]PMM78466.1 hypothetical protein BCT49_00210 [Vibrio lentus]